MKLQHLPHSAKQVNPHSEQLISRSTTAAAHRPRQRQLVYVPLAATSKDDTD